MYRWKHKVDFSKVNYCIDYRNGGMGNTVLAHILYACKKANIDLQNFFSTTGDAHKIQKINSTNLTAQHLVEYPDENLICILELTATGWYELLRNKMSYSKWMLAEPNLNNYQGFFQNHYKINLDDLWLEFYNDLKDPSWPDCKKFDEVPQLPLYIQQEIKEKWNPPEFTVNSEFRLIEFLVFSYYDRMATPFKSKFDCNTYDIGMYFDGKFDQLIDLSQKLGWVWDSYKSQEFHQSVIQNNKTYLTWLNSFKEKYYNILSTNELDWKLPVWEFSFMLAKLFFELNRNPRETKWNNLNCFFDNKSLKLNQLIGL